MTMPKGFRSKKEELESNLKDLNNKLEFLNSKLPKNINPYHIHQEDVTTIEGVERMSRSIDKKLKEIEKKDKTKGITVKNLLIGIISIVIIGVIFYSIITYQPSETNTISIDNTQPSSPYTAPVIESMSNQCKKAYSLGPNEWYKKNCM